MSKSRRKRSNKESNNRSRLNIVLFLVAAALPVAIAFGLRFVPAIGAQLEVTATASHFPASKLPLVKSTLGAEPDYRPRITNVQILDFDNDGRQDVLVCDAQQNQVFWYRQSSLGQWDARPLVQDAQLGAPAHATVVDLDLDGDSDVIVSVLGDVMPTDYRVGSVVWLENDGEFHFTSHVLLDDVRRVADVQPGDLDGDGDVDLVVAIFGFDHGHIAWLENKGNGQFREHRLLMAPGTIHVPIADYDGDGDLDVAAVVTQEEEEVWGFENLGGGKFAPRRQLLWSTSNFDFGGAGLVKTDLDQDGDQDLLLVAGDNLEILYHYPQEYHGCIWLENRGGWNFVPHRIAQFGGAYAAAPGDLDGDGDQDVVLVSMFNTWTFPGAASVVWLENDGRQNFKTWQIADAPTSLCTVACGDLNGDGRDDIVAGGLHIKEPFDRLGRITMWTSGKEAPR